MNFRNEVKVMEYLLNIIFILLNCLNSDVKPRKVVRVGNSYYVSLPKELVNDWGLTVGSLIAVEYRGSDARLYPLIRFKEKGKERVTLISDEYLEKRIISAYLNGYDEIELTIKGRREYVSKAIEKALRLLIGLEVVEEDYKRVLLQCFTGGDYNVYSIIRRLDYLSRSMYLDAIKSLREGRELASSVIERDDKVDRLYFFAVRLIRKSFREEFKSREELLRLLDCRLVAKSLEEIGDRGEAIAREVERGLKATKTAYEQLYYHASEIASFQKRLIKSFVNNEPLDIGEVEELTSKILKELRELIKSREASYLSIVEYLKAIVREVKDVYDLIKRC
ncbi:MAG: hypothetical protein B6U69_01390 [Thermofilum sp. ex4484_15]|nr:MAG: hypothetical protein B6U69_01390 [Thermofilum sp. ex4484_15]